MRDIAAGAGVGVGTVYRHQVQSCAEGGPARLASAPTGWPACSGLRVGAG